MARNTVEVLVDIKKTGTGAQEAEKELTGLEKATRIAGAAMGAFAVKETAAAVFELGKLGAESLRTRSAFTAISGGAGEAATRLDAMKRATRGAISEQDAMASANKLMQMGLADSAESLEKTATLATRLGSAMGKDATQSLEEWTLLMANQSIPRLDTFGVSASKVRARMAELTASVEGMTREQAFGIAATEEAEASLLRLGEAADDDMLAIERLEASSADLKAAFAELLAPAVADVAEEGANFLGGLVEQERAMEEYRRVLGETAVQAIFAEDGYHRQGQALEVVEQRYNEVMATLEQAGTLTDGWVGQLSGATTAAEVAAAANEGLATSASKVAKSFGEMTFDDEQLWKMAMASGASLDQLGILAEHLGIATDAEIEHTLEAYKMVEAFGQGTVTAEELRDSFTDLATEELAATQAAAEASGEIEYLRGGMVDAEQAAGEMTVAFDETAVVLTDVELRAQQVALALEAIPRKVDIEIEYHSGGVPGMQHGGVWPGGVGWVGEGGPELAVFPRGTRIVPAWESRQVARSTTDNRSWSRGGDTIIVQDALAMAMVLEAKRRETSRRLRRGM